MSRVPWRKQRARQASTARGGPLWILGLTDQPAPAISYVLFKVTVLLALALARTGPVLASGVCMRACTRVTPAGYTIICCGWQLTRGARIGRNVAQARVQYACTSRGWESQQTPDPKPCSEGERTRSVPFSRLGTPVTSQVKIGERVTSYYTRHTLSYCMEEDNTKMDLDAQNNKSPERRRKWKMEIPVS
ncbi:hypothetical protein EDB87DRAFT_1573822 [Lactarius vividus]|nr:hypothetical protein EDB87DRAFT_1573822 [Lactarius vividus]